jgi:predicted CopG family antitoxin
MAVKTVTLSQDAYDALSALKAEGESFSEVIRRVTGAQTLLSPFAGAWKGAPDAKIQEVRKFLAASDRLSKQKLRRLSKIEVKSGQPR